MGVILGGSVGLASESASGRGVDERKRIEAGVWRRHRVQTERYGGRCGNRVFIVCFGFEVGGRDCNNKVSMTVEVEMKFCYFDTWRPP